MSSSSAVWRVDTPAESEPGSLLHVAEPLDVIWHCPILTFFQGNFSLSRESPEVVGDRATRASRLDQNSCRSSSNWTRYRHLSDLR